MLWSCLLRKFTFNLIRQYLPKLNDTDLHYNTVCNIVINIIISRPYYQSYESIWDPW